MSKKIVKEGLRNSVYMLVSQSVNLILGIIRSVLLPILLGVVNFGYWQVYLLFLSFAGPFTFGVSDGLYLRYGRYEYEDLPAKKLRPMILFFIFFQLIFVLILSGFLAFEGSAHRKVAIQWAIINIPILGLTGVLSCILQATNQIKKFSLFAMIDKLLVLFLVLGILLLRFDNYVLVIYADTFARLFALILMIISCRKVIFGKMSGVKEALFELWQNLSVGVKVMLASLTGTLILTFGALYIERNMPIENYSVYSFSTSTIALVLIMVGALGMVIYPTLARIEEKKYPRYYLKMNKILNILVYFILTAYFPLILFISIFMPKYVGLFPYLPIIFAIIMIQSKMHILINPYFKLIREETEMLISNLIGVAVAIVLVVISFSLFKSEIAVATATFLAMLYRMLTMEKYLFNKMDVKKSVFTFDVAFIVFFISCAYIPNLLLGCFLYLIGFYIYASLRLSGSIKPSKVLKRLQNNNLKF